MGNVNFNTQVTKTVDLNKIVNLDVNKDVFVFTDIQDNLATAEASADAVGTGGGGRGERIKIPFNVDGFTDGQLVTANAVIGPNPESDGPVMVTDTDFSNLQRTLFAEVLSNEGQADLGINDILIEKLAFDQGNNTFGNSFADYDLPGGADPFPLDDNAGIVQDALDNIAAGTLDDICYTFTFSDIDWDPGQDENGDAATVRVSFWVEDTSGNTAIQTVLFVPGDDGTGFGGPAASDGLELTGLFAALVDEDLANSLAPPGTVINSEPAGGSIIALGTEDDADGNGSSVDFDNLAGFQILLEDEPGTAIGGNPFSSADFFALDSVVEENPSVDGTDASARFDWTTCIQEDEFGLLAETDTFAQVEPEGAFSFSESLAALSGVENNIDIFG